MSTEWDGYFYVEDLGLTQQQRLTLVNELKAWGLKNQDLHPNLRNHWHIRKDNKAVIFEAVFDADNMTELWFSNELAEIFSVPVGNITVSTTNTEYGPVSTFKYNNVDRLRMGIFGGLSADWLLSLTAALHFLADNQAAWGI